MVAVHAWSEERSSEVIAVAADPNGLAYDRARRTLYVADGETGAVLAVSGGRTRRVAAIAAAGVVDGNRLGGIAVGPGGGLFVARLGHGHAGAVFALEPGAEPRALPGLCPRQWRLGVAYDAGAHAVYAAQYSKGDRGPCDGAVVRVDLSTGELTTAATGLVKPIGVVVVGGSLVISDARQRAVICMDRAGRRVFAELGRPDAIAACSPDSVAVTTFDDGIGAVHRVWLDGRSQRIAQGRWEPRGVACDGERVYVAARRAGCVRVFPL